MFNPLKIFRKNKVGLTLGSGGAKGIAHIAVIEYLEELKIPIHYISGSSIGSVIGAVYSYGKLNEFKNAVLSLTKKDVRSLFDPVLPRSGLLRGADAMKFIGKFIPEDVMIEDLKIPLSIVATDFLTGKAVVFKSGNLLDAVRASLSIPGIFIPVKFKDTFLIDGGVADPLPVNVVRDMGANLTVAVNLHPGLKKRSIEKIFKKNKPEKSIGVDSKFIKIVEEKDKPGSGISKSGIFSTVEHFLGLDEKNDMPNIFEVIMQSVDIMEYVNTMYTLQANPPTVLIEPQLLDTGTMDFFKAGNILIEGKAACDRVSSALKGKVKIWV
jgi:NTE family protein